MAENVGNSNKITRDYLDSLLIETRYINSAFPDQSLTLYGQKFPSPIMTAALSHLDQFMMEGAAKALAKGAAETGTILWYGMAEDAEIEALASCGAPMIEIIKPYQDREEIYRKIRHAEGQGLLAVGIDIDHPFADNGQQDMVHGIPMHPMTTDEIRDICAATKLPVILKGVLSAQDAKEAVKAGAQGIVLSHHNNRIEYALPPLKILPEIKQLLPASIPIFVDGEIRTGMDVFKALALGANAVCIGRPLMTAIKNDPENGVRDYLLKARDQLAKAMAYTGCVTLDRMDPSVIHQG